MKSLCCENRQSLDKRAKYTNTFHRDRKGLVNPNGIFRRPLLRRLGRNYRHFFILHGHYFNLLFILIFLFFLPTVDTPSFAISRTPGFGYPLREGIEVSLKCDVDSNPTSTPVWQKDDGDTPVSFRLHAVLFH